MRQEQNVAEGYPEGTLLCLTRAVASLSGGHNLREGEQFTVEDYVSEEECEDEPRVAFYWGSNNGGMNNVCVPADATALVKTAADMRARRPPTPEAVARHLVVLGDHDVFDADETDPEGNTVTVYGSTPDGLRVCVRLVVAEVFEVDS